MSSITETTTRASEYSSENEKERRMDEELFNELTSMVKKRLISMGITPKVFLNINSYDLQNKSKLESITKKIAESKCLFYITKPDWSKEAKALKKNKLSLSNISPFYIGLASEKGDMYNINTGKSLEDYFNNLEAAIDTKPSNYFIKTIKRSSSEITKNEENNKGLLEGVDLLNKENKIESFPELADLTKKELLVVCLLEGKEKDKIVKILDKYYPNKYSIMTLTDYYKYIYGIEIKHTYVLFFKQILHESNEIIDPNSITQSNGSSDIGGVKTTLTSQYYYVLKNLENFNTYYTTNEEKLKNMSNDNRTAAFYYYFNAMKNHYELKGK